MKEKPASDEKEDKGEREAQQALQERYMQAQMVEQQLKQLQKYLDAFDEQLVAIRALKDAINEFSELKKGERIMAPLTNGIFVKATLEDPANLMINVGQNTVVSKTIPEAIEMLSKQEGEVLHFRKETMAQLERLMQQVEEFNLE